MVLKLVTLVAIVVGALACSNQTSDGNLDAMNTKQQEPMQTEEARTVYTLNCASCHGGDGKLKASNAADLSKSIATEAGIRRTILKGNKKGMMPYEQILTKREVEGLVKFVKTLRKK